MLASKSMLPQSTCNSTKSVHKTKVANLKRSKSIIFFAFFFSQYITLTQEVIQLKQLSTMI